MSLNDVFIKLQSSRKAEIASEATKEIRVIQKFIILDDTERLFSYLDEIHSDFSMQTRFLRFLVHMILFLDQVSNVNRPDVVKKYLEM